MDTIAHDFLPCGMEYGAVHLPKRHIVSFQIRVLAGCGTDPADRLGLANLVEQTIDKGTESHTGQSLSDAFDAIGAGRNSVVGRETTTFTCTVLPEHFEQAVALHAEIMRRPTFPDEAFRTNSELAKQELIALEDDAHSLTDKLITAQTYGSVLGRHPLGDAASLDRITRDHLLGHWKAHYHPGRMIATVAGPIEPKRIADVLERHFAEFGSPDRLGRETTPADFQALASHHQKDLEQEQIFFCFPGEDATHDEFPTQQVLLGVLSGGMSGRLFTEVREKRGLVYWVGAWQDTPRGAGTIFLGASTKPDRCDETYETLLSEVDRLGDDLEQDELDRAITGIVANQETRGDATRSRCSELANDLFFFGKPIPVEEKLAKVSAVTIDRIKAYLVDHPRNRLSVVTLGPRPLTHTPGAATATGVAT